MYAALGRPLAGLIPLVVSIAVGAAFVRFVVTKRLGILALLVLGLMVILPLLLQLSLGGFVYASAVVVWAFAAPLGALLLRPARETTIWLAAFFADLLIAALLDGTVAQQVRPLPEAAINALFALNIAGIGTLTFVGLIYFRSQRDVAE